MADGGYSGAQPLPNSFYLPLISDSSGDTYPSNKLTHFRVQLESPLYFGDDEWECGLAEVLWPPPAGGSRKRGRRETGPLSAKHKRPPGPNHGTSPPAPPPSRKNKEEEEFDGIFAAHPTPARPSGPKGPPTDLKAGPKQNLVTVPTPGNVPPPKSPQPVTLAPTAEEDVPHADDHGAHNPTPPADPTAAAGKPVRPNSAEAAKEKKKDVDAAERVGLQPSSQPPLPPQEAETPSPTRLDASVTETGENQEDNVTFFEADEPPPIYSRSLKAVVAPGARAFIYCDVIRPSLCSDFRGKCLRIVPVGDRMTNQALHPVYYFPVEKRVVDTIYVEVKDKYADYLALEASEQPLVLVLHFKRAAVAL